MSSTSAQRLRLKQVPIDEWSTREKLSLASSVLRSGDQNWYSVSRSLKPFGEPNRPIDWFSQKNCALQYSELLEKVETPKRKRGERGENTAEDLIVRELTQKRIDELKILTSSEKLICKKLQQELELLKSSKATEENFQQLKERMHKEEKNKELAEEEYKKWLVDREAKIAFMKASRHNLLTLRSPKTAKQTSAASEASEDKSDTTANDNDNTQVSEPLLVKVEDKASFKDNSLEEDKDLHLQSSSTPSTSPLLTSLLQSPSPTTQKPLSTPAFNILSSASLKELQQRNSPSHSHFFAMPTSSSSTSSLQTSAVNSTSITSLSTSTSQAVSSNSQNISSTNVEGNSLTLIFDQAAEMPSLLAKIASPSAVSRNAPNTSPTLSKLLEMPTDSSLTLPASNESQSEGKEIKSFGETIKDDQDEPMQIDQDNKLKDNETKEFQANLEVGINVEVAKSEFNDSSAKLNIDAKVNKVEQEKVLSENESLTDKEFKKQSLELKEALEEGIVNEDIRIKYESVSNNELKSPEITPLSSRSKRKQISTSMSTSTPTATRRSDRVRAFKDKVSPDKDQNASSLSEYPTTGAKKLNKEVSLDVTINEESTDGSKTAANKASSATDSSVPNSPVSTSALIEDPESVKEYKMWKKSIMLLWRQAATHKFSTLFSHPVTDNEAQGYSTVVYRPMDLLTIRKKIENGTIKTTAEFQRDIMLMFQNAIMYNSIDHDVHQMAVEMQKEILEGIEDYIETQQQGSSTVANESKTRGRRSNVLSIPALSTPSVSETQDPETNIALRRKSRSFAETETSNTTPSTKSKTKKK